MDALRGKQILLGVTGSIAAYKAADLLRRLQEQGADVRVAMTKNAERFVSRLTFETLSGKPVPGVEFQDWEQQAIGHVDITSGLDLALVAPATANLIGKLASGIADDTLTTALLAADCPLLIAPAMNDRMYRNPVVQHNIVFLKGLGVRFIDPGTGSLACGTVGQGRLAELPQILQAVHTTLRPSDFSGMRVLVTAGPTREHIDPVRFISNPSTGKMGFALANAARSRGADVVLISGPTEKEPPAGVTVFKVGSAEEMNRVVMDQAERSEIVIMAAAVSDFKPTTKFDRKIKKREAQTTIQLEQTRDILVALGAIGGKRLLVGFAAETDNLETNAVKKLREKNLDLIVANDVSQEGAGFGTDTNSVLLITRSGEKSKLPVMAKDEIAHRVLDKIREILKK